MARTMSTRTHDGGKLTIASNGGGFTITRERGYRETPEERQARIAYSRRGGVHKRKDRPGRSKVRQDLRSGKW